MRKAFWRSSLILAVLTACQTSEADLQPAQLADTSDEAMFILPGQIAEAIGEANVTLGPIDKAQASTLSVLPARPAPLEGNSTAIPRTFDLVMKSDTCWLQEAKSARLYRLDSVSCTLLSR